MLPETPRATALKCVPTAHLAERPMNEERLIDIESKLAFQEDHLEQLNRTVFEQQQKIERLEAICEALARQMRTLAEAGNEKGAANERPPHY
jgi:SlyX protein